MSGQDISKNSEPPTPGPWQAMFGVEEADDMRCGVAAVRGDRLYLIATIENGAPGDLCDTEKANAILMAAAPAMLAALKACLPPNLALNNCNVRDDQEIPLLFTMGELRRIKAAIDQAEGCAAGEPPSLVQSTTLDENQ